MGLHTRDMGKKRKVDGQEVVPDLLVPALVLEACHHVIRRQLADEYYNQTTIKVTFMPFFKYAVIRDQIRPCAVMVSKRALC